LLPGLAEKEGVGQNIAHFMLRWRTVIGELFLNMGKKALRGRMVGEGHALTTEMRVTS